jgi:tetratricopeptide (TPR) repeat protein
MPSLRDLMERRVPQYLAIYLGAGWGLIEFISFIEERYAISSMWTDLVLLAWAVFIPSVILFTWHHGRPGRDRWVRSEKVFIPLNAIVAVGLLGTAFSTRASATTTTTTVTLTDETGATVERAVARSEYRKRLAIFDFDVPAGDTAIAWLNIGAASLLTSDLSQDIFLDMRVTAHFRDKLQEAGVRPGQPVPAVLQRRIAEDLHLPYYVSGSVSRSGESITIRAVLHETETGTLMGERSVTGTDVLTLIDELTPLLKKDLGLPRTQAGIVKDLPVGEVLSPVLPAVRSLVEAQAAILRDDWAAAEQMMVRATQLDPAFAFAHFGLYQVRALRGDAQGAMPSLEEAMNHLYRMPERMQFLVKVERFLNQRETDKAYAVANMMTELFPDDLGGLQIRLQLEGMRYEHDRAITTLRRMLELDPKQHERLLELGRLQEQKGAFEDALGTYSTYAQRFPQQSSAQLRLAGVQQFLGRLDGARQSLDRALLLDPTGVDVMTDYAAFLRNSGDYAAAERYLAQAGSAARTPQDRTRTFAGLQSYHDVRGRMKDAISAGTQRIAAAAEFMPPVTVLRSRMSLLRTYVKAGERAQAEAALEQIRAQMSGQIAEFWRIGQLYIALETRDTVQLREAMTAMRVIIDDFGLRAYEPEIAQADGVLHEARGDWAGALRAYGRAKDLEPANLAMNRDIARVLRHLGRHDEALAAAEHHLRTVPMAALTNLEAARIHLARGNRNAAREHVARVATAWRDADPSFIYLADLRELQAALGN